MGTEFFHAHIETDMTKQLITFRDFSKAFNYRKRNGGPRSNVSDLKLEMLG
jgi:hypothetical protein